MADFITRRIAATLAGKALHALSPRGRQQREEAERVAAMFGFGGMSERELRREAVRRGAEEEAFQLAVRVEAERLATEPEYEDATQRERWRVAWRRVEKQTGAHEPSPEDAEASRRAAADILGIEYDPEAEVDWYAVGRKLREQEEEKKRR